MSADKVKKRPPKLTLDIRGSQSSSAEDNQVSTATSVDEDKRSLDSTVKVRVGDCTNILIAPNELKVTQQLGRGQYGVVERVTHEPSGCEFAVKRVALRPNGERLVMDVDILVKGTDCKNIIKFFGAMIWEGDLWILMELMDCSLDKFYKLAHRGSDSPKHSDNPSKAKLPQTGPCNHLGANIQLGDCNICNPIPEKVLGRMAADIVNALNYLYSIKVIHRDVKPSNILISREGIIKLCDFGISGYLENSIARTYEAGCRAYMAPERIDPPRDRAGYDIKSDVWSFGITMLEIATGRYPYQYGRDFFAQLKAICTDDPPKLTEGRFTEVFQNFLSVCLMKDYESRPKYCALEAHPFIQAYKSLDISAFVSEILCRLCSEVSTNAIDRH